MKFEKCAYIDGFLKLDHICTIIRKFERKLQVYVLSSPIFEGVTGELSIPPIVNMF